MDEFREVGEGARLKAGEEKYNAELPNEVSSYFR